MSSVGPRQHICSSDGSGPATDIRQLKLDAALSEPGTDLRLFGKPESFIKRRMGVALARDVDTDGARAKAKRAAAKVKPRAV